MQHFNFRSAIRPETNDFLKRNALHQIYSFVIAFSTFGLIQAIVDSTDFVVLRTSVCHRVGIGPALKAIVKESIEQLYVLHAFMLGPVKIEA